MKEWTLGRELAQRYKLLSDLIENGACISGIDYLTVIRHACYLIYAGEFDAAAKALQCTTAVGKPENEFIQNMEIIAKEYVSSVLKIV